MFVTNHFVFLHLPKTAGIYFESICTEELKMEKLLSKRHAKYSSLPPEHLGKQTIGIWRNPWDWYASLYFFAKKDRNAATSDFVALASEGYVLNFEQTLARLVNPDEDFIASYEKRMAELGGRVKDFECLDVTSMRRVKESGEGLMTFLAKEIFPEKLDHEWMFESLGQFTFKYLGELGVARDGLRKAMVSPKKNVSSKPSLGLVYSSQEALDLVARSDAEIIQRFGYVPPEILISNS